jgi:hypothetical protein
LCFKISLSLLVHFQLFQTSSSSSAAAALSQYWFLGNDWS